MIRKIASTGWSFDAGLLGLFLKRQVCMLLPVYAHGRICKSGTVEVGYCMNVDSAWVFITVSCDLSLLLKTSLSLLVFEVRLQVLPCGRDVEEASYPL
jgi:hypothetical protein